MFTKSGLSKWPAVLSNQSVYKNVFFVLEDHPPLWRGQHMFCTIILLNHARIMLINSTLNWILLSWLMCNHKLHEPFQAEPSFLCWNVRFCDLSYRCFICHAVMLYTKQIVYCSMQLEGLNWVKKRYNNVTMYSMLSVENSLLQDQTLLTFDQLWLSPPVSDTLGCYICLHLKWHCISLPTAILYTANCRSSFSLSTLMNLSIQ